MGLDGSIKEWSKLDQTPTEPLPSTEEIQRLTDRAEKGDAKAQYRLGVMYRDGVGVQNDLRKAREWFTKAADQGHEEAKSEIACPPISMRSEGPVATSRTADSKKEDLRISNDKANKKRSDDCTEHRRKVHYLTELATSTSRRAKLAYKTFDSDLCDKARKEFEAAKDKLRKEIQELSACSNWQMSSDTGNLLQLEVQCRTPNCGRWSHVKSVIDCAKGTGPDDDMSECQWCVQTRTTAASPVPADSCDGYQPCRDAGPTDPECPRGFSPHSQPGGRCCCKPQR